MRNDCINVLYSVLFVCVLVDARVCVNEMIEYMRDGNMGKVMLLKVVSHIRSYNPYGFCTLFLELYKRKKISVCTPVSRMLQLNMP